MAHRPQTHKAEKFMESLNRYWNLDFNIKKTMEMKDTIRDLWPDEYYFPIFASSYTLMGFATTLGHNPASLVDLVKSGKLPCPEAISCFAEWQRSKHIFRFDNDFREELIETNLSSDIPLEVIRRLPYDCFFVDCPVTRATLSLNTHDCQGFFVYRTLSNYLIDGVETKNAEQLVVLYLNDDNVVPLQISLNKPMVKQIIDEFYYTDIPDEDRVVGIKDGKQVTVNDLCLEKNISYNEYKKIYYDKMYNQLKHIFNIIIYICSQNPDLVTVYKPCSKGKQPKQPKPQAFIHEVGTRIGPALHQAWIAYEKQNGNHTGQKKAPHIRRGHPHRFWVGPRDEEQKLIVKWLPPQGINLNLGNLIPTIHKVKGGRD